MSTVLRWRNSGLVESHTFVVGSELELKESFSPGWCSASPSTHNCGRQQQQRQGILPPLQFSGSPNTSEPTGTLPIFMSHLLSIYLPGCCLLNKSRTQQLLIILPSEFDAASAHSSSLDSVGAHFAYLIIIQRETRQTCITLESGLLKACSQ